LICLNTYYGGFSVEATNDLRNRRTTNASTYGFKPTSSRAGSKFLDHYQRRAAFAISVRRVRPGSKEVHAQFLRDSAEKRLPSSLEQISQVIV
jgi:hypothetical protein